MTSQHGYTNQNIVCAQYAPLWRHNMAKRLTKATHLQMRIICDVTTRLHKQKHCLRAVCTFMTSQYKPNQHIFKCAGFVTSQHGYTNQTSLRAIWRHNKATRTKTLPDAQTIYDVTIGYTDFVQSVTYYVTINLYNEHKFLCVKMRLLFNNHTLLPTNGNIFFFTFLIKWSWL